MEQNKVVLLSLIDPFAEKPYLMEKTHDELMGIFDKLNINLYEFEHKDYAPSRVLPSIAKKFRDVSSKEQELARREENIRKKEAEYGIRSQLRTRDLTDFAGTKRRDSNASTPSSIQRQVSSNISTPNNVQKQNSISKHQNANLDHFATLTTENQVKHNTQSENVRNPDPIIRTRLIAEDLDPEMEYAMRLSSDEFYRTSNINAAISKSMEDAKREEDASYRHQEMRKAREEKYMKKQSEMQDEYDDAFASSLNQKQVDIKYEEEEINIDITKFSDRPPDVTAEILKEICILLKKQDFDGARKIIGTLSSTSSAWVVRLKCEKGSLKSKIVSRDVEAYKCILCHK